MRNTTTKRGRRRTTNDAGKQQQQRVRQPQQLSLPVVLFHSLVIAATSVSLFATVVGAQQHFVVAHPQQQQQQQQFSHNPQQQTYAVQQRGVLIAPGQAAGGGFPRPQQLSPQAVVRGYSTAQTAQSIPLPPPLVVAAPVGASTQCGSGGAGGACAGGGGGSASLTGGYDFNPALLAGTRGYPGIKARINSRGFQYFSSIIGPILSQQIKSARIPNINQCIPQVSGCLQVYNIYVSRFRCPQRVILYPAPPNQIVISVENLDIGVTGNLGGQINILVPIALSGIVQMNAHQVSIRVSLVIDRAPSGGGGLYIRMASCQVTLGYVDVFVENGGLIGDIANSQFRGRISEMVRSMLPGQVCGQLPSIINDQLNGKLTAIPQSIALTQMLQIAMNAFGLNGLLNGGGSPQCPAKCSGSGRRIAAAKAAPPNVVLAPPQQQPTLTAAQRVLPQSVPPPPPQLVLPAAGLRVPPSHTPQPQQRLQQFNAQPLQQQPQQQRQLVENNAIVKSAGSSARFPSDAATTVDSVAIVAPPQKVPKPVTSPQLLQRDVALPPTIASIDGGNREAKVFVAARSPVSSNAVQRRAFAASLHHSDNTTHRHFLTGRQQLTPLQQQQQQQQQRASDDWLAGRVTAANADDDTSTDDSFRLVASSAEFNGRRRRRRQAALPRYAKTATHGVPVSAPVGASSGGLAFPAPGAPNPCTGCPTASDSDSPLGILSVVLQTLDFTKLSNIYLTVQLLQAYATTNDYTIDLNGEFSPNGAGGTPFGAFPMQFPTAVGHKMAEILISDWTVNTLFYHLHRSGFLNIRIGPQTPKIGDLLKTTCSSDDEDDGGLEDHGVETDVEDPTVSTTEATVDTVSRLRSRRQLVAADDASTASNVTGAMALQRRIRRQDAGSLSELGICLGDILPAVREKYPNQKIYISLHSSRAPSVLLSSRSGGSATLEFVADADIYIEATNEKVGTIQAAATVEFVVKTSGGRISAHADITNLQLRDLGNTLGLPQDALDNLGNLGKELILKAGNEALEKGAPLSVPQGVAGLPLTFIDPEVRIVDHAVHLAADFTIAPSALAQLGLSGAVGGGCS